MRPSMGEVLNLLEGTLTVDPPPFPFACRRPVEEEDSYESSLELDLDGNLRLYSWVEVSRSWRSVWQAVENQCNVFATCGERGICVFNASRSPDCKCPFKYNSASNSKCLLPNQCKSSSTWVELEHTLLYGMYPANDSISQSSLQRCKDMCLHDSLCMAVTFTNNRAAECRMITTQYMSGYSDPSISSASFEFSENFKYPIGPKMFKGMLPHIDNQPVAIKELDTTTEQRKFRGAVSKIGNIHHKNLTKLEGYCCEYIEDSKLFKRLTWKKRVDICTSVARALCYLHTGCREFVSHGNLKCENVLLDENFEAKVTDFGLGIFHGDASVYGTSAGKDVEDFGKMVLILVNGSREVEDVCEWAYNEWMEGRQETIIDKRIVGGVDPEKLERVLRIAFWCLQNDERMRPSMGEVLNVLEGTLTVDPPPFPFACRRPVEEEDSYESSLESYSATEH
ncbi:G-type lectin S-receptor-like serine/threonine-protein kinase SD3-1 [Citrus sinensis]|nr:G-type lectin S-receptor-like serine/threonine-protein kinase SD3-1 [Citrus sinensis]